MRQQFFNLAVLLRGQALQHILQIGIRIMPIELGALNQTHHSGGTLPGTPSTVVDLRAYEDDGLWAVLRDGAVPAAVVGTVLDPTSSGEQSP